MLVVLVIVFLRAVSHQLYGDPSHHLAIRAAGVTGPDAPSKLTHTP